MSSWRTELDVLDQQLRDQYGPPGRYDKYDFGQLNVYFCGARMLDRLHSKLGNATFERVLEGWPARFRYRNADRLQWIRFLDKTSGRNLRAWVTRWLDSNRSPV
jgi:aminopeptidase N